ncbi:hypothetical protein O181_013231 [Austropuccinia psidii MF-1]|uniref:Uncharacterized protein n=1 Tax=Austropuccinia psidii MF-1 TaxID=1389203 RepID=A0A9Q3GN10_9BASI|nr:hypothetical protein [Austropuccinia psidii MF-1]
MPCEQTLQEPTPGLSGTQWSEDLFPKPSQHNEPHIPSLSQSSESQVPSHEKASTCEPEPELVPLLPAPSLSSTIHPSASPLLFPLPPLLPQRSQPPISPHSHNDAQQEFTNLRPALMIPQAIFHDPINQILLENHQLLPMIPFVDTTHQNEMHMEFQEELNSSLAQEIEAYPKEDITRIV